VSCAIVVFDKYCPRGKFFPAVNANKIHVHDPLFFFFSNNRRLGDQFRPGLAQVSCIAAKLPIKDFSERLGNKLVNKIEE